MFLIDIDACAAEELIAEITKHIPPGDTLGKVRFVSPEGLIADYDERECVWNIDDAGAWRQLQIGDGEHELTQWYWGAEESRRVVREGADEDD